MSFIDQECEKLKGCQLKDDHVSIKSLSFLCLPLILHSSLGTLCLFLNRVFLAQHDQSAFEAGAIAYAFFRLFQIVPLKMASEAQVFVSRSCAEGNDRKVGVYLWQMIWLSLAVVLLLFPISFVVRHFSFDDSPVQQQASHYFTLMMFGIFLYPLNAALCSFYTARKKTNVLLSITFVVVIVHIGLGWILIGGWEPYIRALGLTGAALSVLIPQSIVAIVLTFLILRKKNREKYGTNQWRIDFKALKSCFKVGFFNGLSATLIFFGWTLTVTIVMWTGNADYLLILAFGNSCSLFFNFLDAGVGQTVTISASRLIGEGKWTELPRLIHSSIVFLLPFSGILLFFFVIYPESVLTLFFPTFPEGYSIEFVENIKFSCAVLWLFQLNSGIDRIIRSILTATGDTVYMFKIYMVYVSLGSFLPIYMIFYVWNAPYHLFWLVSTFFLLLRNVPLVMRIYRKKLQQHTSPLVST